MKTNIVRIGNSKGIRLPKSVLEQCRLTDAVELVVDGNTLVVRPANVPRSGWSEAFQNMAKQGDDVPLDKNAPAVEWDRKEWKW